MYKKHCESLYVHVSLNIADLRSSCNWYNHRHVVMLEAILYV